jgi:Holliday junction resolvase-like predicted endonuclease
LSIHVFTQKHVFDTCIQLEREGMIGFTQVQVQCSFPPSQPPRFLYSTQIDPLQRDQTIQTKVHLLTQHYDNQKRIGDHAEHLVEQVCRELGYERIHPKKRIGNFGEIDVYAKHPSDEYWQAISVKNLRDPIKMDVVRDLLSTVEHARLKYPKKIIQPAIVASYAYLNVIQNEYHVPVAIIGKQVAPTALRGLYEELNDKLAFDVAITDRPPDTMRENIRLYICKHDYDRDQRATAS